MAPVTGDIQPKGLGDETFEQTRGEQWEGESPGCRALGRGSAGCATWMSRMPFRGRGHGFTREAARVHAGTPEARSPPPALRARRQAAVTGAGSP